ncbi:MAG: tetratricopeptide repeat protein, partial [Alphaproteobacteria bacterium]|nr:tetratricopeptide repeat protein [Alphaproteobacteria bacterium]
QLGSVLVDLEDFPMAERCFRAALDIAPGDPMSRGKLADALARQGRREEAGREFKVALETSSSDARLWALYSVMLAGEGSRDGAIEAAGKAREIDPNSIDVELALLETFNLLGAADAVADSKERLRALAPDDARVDAATA